MINGRRVVMIFPARAGSKRIPGKNLQPIGGKPLLEFVHSRLKPCGIVDEFWISTDSQEYADKASACGMRVIDRPAELAGDSTFILPVIQHAARKMGLADDDIVIQGDLCKPLFSASLLETAIRYFVDYGLDSLFPVKPLSVGIIKNLSVTAQDRAEVASSSTRRAPVYIHHSPCRIRSKACLSEADPMTWGLGIKHHFYPIVPEWDIDINTLEDLICARALVDAGY
jgi:CMP-N-acetylneuraminic acid synthetase